MKLRTAISAVLLTAGAALGTAGVAVADSPVTIQLWAKQGSYGTPSACELSGIGEVAVGHARAYYCEQNNRPLGTVWDLYLDYI
ncbi:hypothetical protein ACFFQW_10795 [Umezawaea endophytica]|uniref:Ig-like domain-containing protein n=1 Tax=Umezawaea endophytica TaxID=1654476 RepID=A0A9X3AIU0_9PSEU|nr:hypothetical protein [Umezawaea endophytica]MCS7483542.1 hypothetical protein [Umezawaea endophytica]